MQNIYRLYSNHIQSILRLEKVKEKYYYNRNKVEYSRNKFNNK